MAYYDALIAAWNGATQPPAGVTGTGLSAGDTTPQKIAKVNAWTQTGAVPTSFFVTGAQLLNCINYPEFKALTDAQQKGLLGLFQVQGNLLGGSGNTAFMVDGMILDYFTNHTGPTVIALTALAQGTVTPWWQTGAGLSSPVSLADTQNAGLS